MKKLDSSLKNMLLSLTGFSVVAGALLGWVNNVTAGPIAQANAKALSDAIALVVPGFDNNPAESPEEVEVGGTMYKIYRATKDGNFIGAAVEASAGGFGGALTVLVGLIVAIMHVLSAFIATDANKMLLLRSMGAGKLQILWELVIPSSYPAVISMLKVNVGMAWIGSIMGEYIVSRAGLGYLIVYGGQVFKLDLVMSATFVLCLLAAGMYALVVLLEKVLVKNTDS